MYFPRRLWDGFSVEAGSLRRDRDTRIMTSSGAGINDTTDTQTTTYSGRAMVGWSWLVANHAFVSVAAGISAGYETGTEKTRRPTPLRCDALDDEDIGRLDGLGRRLPPLRRRVRHQP